MKIRINSEYAYKGKRIHIIRIVYEDGSITNKYEIFDNRIGVEFGAAWLLDDGTWKAEVWYGPHSIPFMATTVREVAQKAYAYLLDPIMKG